MTQPKSTKRMRMIIISDKYPRANSRRKSEVRRLEKQHTIKWKRRDIKEIMIEDYRMFQTWY